MLHVSEISFPDRYFIRSFSTYSVPERSAAETKETDRGENESLPPPFPPYSISISGVEYLPYLSLLEEGPPV